MQEKLSSLQSNWPTIPSKVRGIAIADECVLAPELEQCYLPHYPGRRWPGIKSSSLNGHKSANP